MASKAETARKKHLQILLERLTAHADVVRHHLPGMTHNATLGFAAEAGVRDVLRSVLPRRLAITSGFIRSTGGDLIVPTTKGSISPQTDILIYDASRSCPLYGIDGVEVIAAPDVLGVIEVKDSRVGEGDLGPLPPGDEEEGDEEEGDEEEGDEEEGDEKPRKKMAEGDHALRHIAALATAAPRAFRGVVLIQGGNAKSARKRMDHQKLTDANVPHVVYCRALVRAKKSPRRSYLAFHDYLSNQVCFHVHEPEHDDQALAGFLRIISGFFAAQGLTTAAIPSDLRPAVPKEDASPPPLRLDGRPAISSLRDRVLAVQEASDGPTERPSYEKMLDRFFDEEKKRTLAIRTPPVVGLDRDRMPTSGPLLLARWNDGSDQEHASFFAMSPAGNLVCVDAPDGKPMWMIIRESVDVYLRRVCQLDAAVFADEAPPEAYQAPGLDAPADERYLNDQEGR